ncbi:MAG: alginate export family protein [Bacteriovoracaceae bacterium]
MKMRNVRFCVAMLALSSSMAFAQEAPLKNIKISGWGFWRQENKNNADYQTSTKDKQDFNQTRMNVSLKGDLADNYGYVFFAPQFSRISGSTDYVSGTTTVQQSSGQLYNPRLDMHEAYIALRPTQDENLHLIVGRQELAYGDHLILGSVPWHRIGRAFDGGRVSYKISPRLTVDAFMMKLLENQSAPATTSTPSTTDRNGNQDTNFNGIYIYGDQGKYLTNTDFYILKKENSAVGSFSDTTAYGLRLKSKMGETNIDYRAESTLEQVKLLGESTLKDAYQYDLELGYTFPFYTTRMSFEYLSSSKNYDQLFPTAHKFLGYADQFSRRNIKSYVAHLSTKPNEKVTFFADYHIFQRNNNGYGAYNFGGSSVGTVGNSRDIGNELDLVVAYDFTKTVQVSYGYSWVNAGKYIKDQNSKNNAQTHWSFLQLLVRF